MKNTIPAGYNHFRYAQSFREYGEPYELSKSGGWILERIIPGTSYVDGMGCYPLFVCQDWSRLHEDLKEIESKLVSLVLVTDPFGAIDRGYLERHFQIVRPFKKHLVADLSQIPELFVNKHHRYYARKSMKDMEVDVCDVPLRYADEWIKLYDNLVTKHKISGIRAFSKDSFLAQLETPGVILIVGKLEKEIIGGQIITIAGNVAYSHLAAFSDIGYKHGASFGIYWVTLQYLKELNIQYFDLGAAAGLEENAQDGLTKFKMGWSNDSRMVYLCGRIFDRHMYDLICKQNRKENMDYFPAYRAGEFVD
jgi:hypothetical protein